MKPFSILAAVVLVLSFPLTLQADEYLGVAFQPYIGAWTGTAPNASVPLYDSYSQSDVSSMVSTLSGQFKFLATYSAGYAGYYSPTKPYNQVDSTWRVGSAAASVNQAAGKKVVDVAQGIFQQNTAALMTAEIEGAFSIAANANQTFAGTVTKLIFTNEYVTDAATTSEVTAMVNQYKSRAKSANLTVGVRSNTFGQITNPKSPYLSEMQALVRACDFIMCNLYPSKQESAADAVADVEAQFNAIRAAAKKLNPNIVVMIGETGWPSQGISFNNTVNTVPNEEAYFKAIREFATKNAIQVYFIEGIDEPWKSNQNSTDKKSFQGPNGGEGHYGLYTATKTADGYTLTPKFDLSQDGADPKLKVSKKKIRTSSRVVKIPYQLLDASKRDTRLAHKILKEKKGFKRLKPSGRIRLPREAGRYKIRLVAHTTYGKRAAAKVTVVRRIR